MTIEALSQALRSRFCESLGVTSVPMGYAISTGFLMPDGDLLGFYASRDGSGLWRLEDDGTTLPNAIAAGLDIESGIRHQLVTGILEEEGANFNTNDYQITTDPMPEDELPDAAMRFVSALIRMKDLGLISRENVKATFIEDVERALSTHLPEGFYLEMSGANDPMEPDMVLRVEQTHLAAASVYAASNDARMMDAVVKHQTHHVDDSPIVAVIDRRKSGVSERRFNMATNLGVQLAVVHDSGHDWTSRVISIAEERKKIMEAA